jgi:hypothetical protein
MKTLPLSVMISSGDPEAAERIDKHGADGLGGRLRDSPAAMRMRLCSSGQVRTFSSVAPSASRRPCKRDDQKLQYASSLGGCGAK